MSGDLIMLIGLPGSGKTTLANWLVDHHGVTVISRDTIRAAMFPRCRYSLEEKHAAFDAMQTAILIALQQGQTVCTDGMTFADHSDRMVIEEVADRAGARVRHLWCDIPVPVAQQRVRDDAVTVFPDRDEALVQSVADRFMRPDDAYRLDMTEPVDVIGERVIGWLEGVDA